ncbi:hypothetical protein KBZ21_42855, partial [Streptomyces sp. A73]|nr:hypothetical protein [Streptomyces sp. A73]
ALARGIASIASTLPWLVQGMYLALIVTRLWTIGMAIFNAVKSAVRAVATAFEKAKDALGKSWAKIKSLTRKPIKWVID